MRRTEWVVLLAALWGCGGRAEDEPTLDEVGSDVIGESDPAVPDPAASDPTSPDPAALDPAAQPVEGGSVAAGAQGDDESPPVFNTAPPLLNPSFPGHPWQGCDMRPEQFSVAMGDEQFELLVEKAWSSPEISDSGSWLNECVGRVYELWVEACDAEGSSCFMGNIQTGEAMMRIGDQDWALTFEMHVSDLAVGVPTWEATWVGVELHGTAENIRTGIRVDTSGTLRTCLPLGTTCLI